MNDDGDLMAIVAAEHVHRQGRDAIPYLRERQLIAEEAGDALSAVAWGDIADAAETILFHQTVTLPD